jgi:hypothetical protein
VTRLEQCPRRMPRDNCSAGDADLGQVPAAAEKTANAAMNCANCAGAAEAGGGGYD